MTYLKKVLCVLSITLIVFSPGRMVMGEEGANGKLEALRRAAADELSALEGSGETRDVNFTSGSLSLQALNPEISITGDFLASYRSGDAVEEETDFKFRGLGIHLEADLDPYSHFKAAVEVHEDETELGEA